MEHPGECYYKLNRFILSLNGLWPYQSKWSARLVKAIITIVLLPSVFFQLSSIFTSDITTDFIVDVIPALVPTFGSLCHIYIRVRYVDKLKDLFEHMWNDWRLQKTHYEIKIMRKHAETTRLLTLYYLIIQYIAVIVYSIWMFMPDILDVISPMNESRPRMIPFRAEFFFIDEKQYISLIRSQTCIVIVILTLIFLGISTLFVLLVQHACGMCELLGYRAERLFCVVESTTGCDLIRSKISYGNIVGFIQLHCNIIQFIGMIEMYHTIPFLMDFLGLMLSMSLALTKLTIAGNFEQAFRSSGVVITAMFYLFISNYMGQKVTDMSSSICEKACNSTWYNADVSKQKLLLLIIKRRFHPLILTAYRFYVLSLQNFEVILQMAISYCMFMKQF